jgi:putative transposase
MKKQIDNLSFQSVCRLFGKSRQAWYKIHQAGNRNRLQEELVLQWVNEVRSSLPKVGAVKLHSMIKDKLRSHNMKLGRDGLYKLLGEHGLLIVPRRKYVRTTDSWHHYKKWPDLMQDYHPYGPDQVWVSDITFLRTKTGFIYLSLVTDAYSRVIVGYHLSQRLKASGCIAALHKAIKSCRGSFTDLIHHSDRGIQYCCDDYVQILQSHGISISMTQSGSPYDNAIAERINGILKQEFGLDKTFKSYTEAVELVAKAIYSYNHIRPHFSCDLRTPIQKHYLQTKFTDNQMPNDKNDCQPLSVMKYRSVNQIT